MTPGAPARRRPPEAPRPGAALRRRPSRAPRCNCHAAPAPAPVATRAHATERPSEAVPPRGFRNQDAADFVGHFRSASAYIAGHRHKSFLVVIPGEVIIDKKLLVALVDDLMMLHGMGIKLVLVLGAASQIDSYLAARGAAPRFVKGYRVTDELSMEAAMDAAGFNRVLFEALLSKGPPVPMVRRHARSKREFHYAAAVHVVSGNYLAAQRRGVVHGVDHGYAGYVRFVDAEAIGCQLDGGNIVLLSNLGYSAGGELLNCNSYDVAIHAAVACRVDKLICMHVEDLDLPEWLSLRAASVALFGAGGVDEGSLQPGQVVDDPTNGGPESDGVVGGGEGGEAAFALGGAAQRSGVPSTLEQVRVKRGALTGQDFEPPAAAPPDDYRIPASTKYSQGVLAVYEACRRGAQVGAVTRGHLVDARVDGGVLLELYSRDGIGTMISTDFYEGIRNAGPSDVAGIKELLRGLEARGIVVARSEDSLAAEVATFVVIEREARLIACAQLKPLGRAVGGGYESVAEVAGFAVHPEFRGVGRGDSLLDWIEQDARYRGHDCLVLLTTRTADWFQARDFRLDGPAHESELLSTWRREQVDASRNSQLYMKRIEAPSKDMRKPGERIGF